MLLPTAASTAPYDLTRGVTRVITCHAHLHYLPLEFSSKDNSCTLVCLQ